MKIIYNDVIISNICKYTFNVFRKYMINMPFSQVSFGFVFSNQKCKKINYTWLNICPFLYTNVQLDSLAYNKILIQPTQE
jgi:hypothetical protein